MINRLIAILFLSVIPFSGYAAYTLQSEAPAAQYESSVQDLYGDVLKLYQNKEWKALSKEALNLVKNFPDTPFGQEAVYYLGVAYFELDDFEMANYQFTDYLTKQASPKHFEEAIQRKFEIAEKFRSGARKHLMGFKTMPKWSSASHESISIYDEVIAALPHHDLAASALYGKALVHAKQKEFRSSIESFQTLIRRFPKHPLAVESYIGVGEVYLAQSRFEYPDPDYLDLAEINLKKFRANFPREEKLVVAQQNFVNMQDTYAESLYETARFYERTKKWGAAKIYYQKIVQTYPISGLANKSKERLESVEKKLAKLKDKT